MNNKFLSFFTRGCYFLIGIIILLLFIENFIFSNNFGMLGFRELDDIAFQGSIRTLQDIATGGFHPLLLIKNDYAYGWIYWATTGFLTYPLYLLSTHSFVDWPLIIAPRQMSLMFAVLSLIILRKILKQRNTPEWACAAALLIFALYPTFGYFSLRFGTVSSIMFFSILSVYLAQKNEPSSPQGRILIAITLAIAGGIKLSGLLIAPVVFAFILLRMKEKGVLNIVKALIIPFTIFLFCLALFTNPTFIINPLNAKIRTDYWDILTMFINSTKIPFGPADPAERFFLGVFGSIANALAMLTLALGLVLYFIKEKAVKLELLAILVTMSLVAIYLMHFVKNYLSVGSYFSAVSFLFLLGIIGWTRIRFGFFAIFLILSLQVFDSGIRVKNQWLAQSSELNPWQQWNHFNYFIKEIKNKADIDDASRVDACLNIDTKKTSPWHVVVDNTFATTINPTRYIYACVSPVSNNLSLAAKKCSTPINYIIIDKMALGNSSQADFDKAVQTLDTATTEVFVNDRTARIELTTTGKLGNEQFKPACEYGRYQVFKAID